MKTLSAVPPLPAHPPEWHKYCVVHPLTSTSSSPHAFFYQQPVGSGSSLWYCVALVHRCTSLCLFNICKMVIADSGFGRLWGVMYEGQETMTSTSAKFELPQSPRIGVSVWLVNYVSESAHGGGC